MVISISSLASKSVRFLTPRSVDSLSWVKMAFTRSWSAFNSSMAFMGIFL